MVVTTSEKEKEFEVNPDTYAYMQKLGAFDCKACMNCGLCTVSCPLSVNGNEFPRKMIRYAVLGLESELVSHTEPWTCYYCGECSEQCPSKAEPGEFMMSYRRYLISKYDWTGISRRLYTSKMFEFGSIILIALGILALFFVSGSFDRMNTTNVSINTFAPVMWVHFGDLVLFSVLALLLLSNAFRMFYFVIIKSNQKIPLSLYLTELKTFLLTAGTQNQWLKCSKKMNWFKHFLLVSGYATMFLLIVVFLPIFQIDGTNWHWTSILGYYSTFTIMYMTLDMMYQRLKKSDQMHKYSHSTDWMFLILLFLTALSGIFLHLFRLLNLPLPSYYMYVIHLMIACPMLIIEVPFSKWSHMLYRPLGIYLATVKRKAMLLAEA